MENTFKRLFNRNYRWRILCLVTLLFSFKIYSQSTIFHWANTYGSSFNDEGQSIAVDASGNVFAVGAFRGIVDFDPGPATLSLTSAGVTDVYITKTDPNGNTLWAKQIGNGFAEYVNDIAIDPSGNLLITGAFQSNMDADPGSGSTIITSFGNTIDVFILKLDNNGNFIWAKSMGGTSTDQGVSIATTIIGEVITLGEFASTADFDPGVGTANLSSAGGNDIFVSKLDASGNFVWADRFGGTGTDAGLGITTNSLGIFFTGYFQGIADFDPSVTTFTLNSNGSNDIFICRLNNVGTLNFAINIGGTGADNGNSIITDAAGAILITGQFNGTADFDPTVLTNSLISSGGSDVFVAKYSSGGNIIWVKRMGGAFADYGNSIVTDNLNNVYTTGTFKDLADFDPSPAIYTVTSNSNSDDIFVNKLDALGNFVWLKSFGGVNNDESRAIAVPSNNIVYTTGNYLATVDFDTETGIFNKTSIGGSDVFIHKITACLAPNTPSNTTPNSNLVVCDGQSTSLSAAGSGSLNWYSTASSTIILGSGNVLITPTLSTGTYSYYVEAITCTTSASRTQITVTVSVCSGAIEKLELNKFINVYPNPSNDGIYLIESETVTQAIIMDVFGKILLQQDLVLGLNTLDLSKYQFGIYIMSLKNGLETKTVKLLKE